MRALAPAVIARLVGAHGGAATALAVANSRHVCGDTLSLRSQPKGSPIFISIDGAGFMFVFGHFAGLNFSDARKLSCIHYIW